MTNYNGRPLKWEPTNSNVYFDIPGGGSGRIFIPVRDEETAFAAFHKNWPAIADLAASRYKDGDLDNGQVALDIVSFDPSFLPDR